MFKDRLRQCRKNADLTQEELAEKINLTQSAINNYETGYRRPDYEILCQFADFFGVSTDYLLGRTDNSKDVLTRPEKGQALIIKAKNANVSIDELEAYIEARKILQKKKNL